MDVDALLAGLNPAQREAVTSAAAPLAIHAGAGSGKTRVLTRRIAYRVVTEDADARHVLALTFTRKAAGELRARLRKLGLRSEVPAGTFHALAYAQLRARWADLGREPPVLLERKARFLAPLLPRDSSVSAMEVAGEIEWASARMVEPDNYAEQAVTAGRKPPLEPATMGRIIADYSERKRQRRTIDFDDLLRHCIKGLETDREWAAAQRWQFRHLFVDEFQDVNPLQLRLLRGWLGDSPDLCVVGDPNQSIYGWNGADARFLDRFADHFPGGELVRLEDNYRSSPQILAIANAVLAAGSGRVHALRANVADGPIPTVGQHADDGAEAQAVATAARDAHRPGEPWSHQAVIVRTNGQAATMAGAFAEARIPHRLKGASGLLERPEVRQALRLLEQGPLEQAVPDLEAAASGSDRIDAEAGDPVDGRAAGPNRGSTDGPEPDDEERANLSALARMAREYLTIDPAPTGGGLVAWIRSTVRSGNADDTGDTVDIVTFHSAKGLEWPTVHIAGLEKGLVPIGHAKTDEARAEERRLLYVGVTRAQESLHLHWARQRTFGRRTSQRSASPYLAPVESTIEALAEGADPADWRRHIDENRARLRAADGGRRGRRPSDPTDPADRPVFDALRQWRSGAAKAASVPAYVIFHDATLEAIAASRPSSARELLDVKGIGRVKVARYGEELIEIVREAAAN